MSPTGWFILIVAFWFLLAIFPFILKIFIDISWKGVLIWEGIILSPLLLIPLFLFGAFLLTRGSKPSAYRDFYLPRVDKDLYIPKR